MLFPRLGCSERPQDGSGKYCLLSAYLPRTDYIIYRAITQLPPDWAMPMHSKTLVSALPMAGVVRKTARRQQNGIGPL